MAIIPQRHLFCWDEVEVLGDLERLILVLKTLPDEPLMRVLERKRGNGRDDYPIRAMWNTVLAGVVFGHESVGSLRRELCRNGQLRDVCGLDPLLGAAAVPKPWNYTRFLKALLAHEAYIEGMFDAMVKELCDLLPGFGKTLAMDGKALPSHARGRKTDEEPKPRDGRRDVDADWGVKTRKKEREDGTLYEQVSRWFGYKLHLVVDALYELPVNYAVTRASVSDIERAPKLVKGLKERHPEVVAACEALTGDKGYDQTDFVSDLWDDPKVRIKPVIAIRDCWKDGEETHRVSNQRHVVYDPEGTVYCYCRRTGIRREMAYGGFEAKRGTLKYRCPAQQYHRDCASLGCCSVRGAVRIKMAEDRRIFTPIARSSYRWGREYKKRTAVERVNSRLDVSFGFERHFIRGLAKMRLRMGLALVVMLAMALGRVREKRGGMMRSLVRAA